MNKMEKTESKSIMLPHFGHSSFRVSLVILAIAAFALHAAPHLEAYADSGARYSAWPNITLNGPNPQYVQIGERYTEHGAIAYGGNLTIRYYENSTASGASYAQMPEPLRIQNYTIAYIHVRR